MTDYILSMYYPQVQSAVPDNLEEIMARVNALTDRMRTEQALVWTGGLEFANAARVVTAGEPPLVTDRPVPGDQRGDGRLLDHPCRNARRCRRRGRPTRAWRRGCPSRCAPSRCEPSVRSAEDRVAFLACPVGPPLL